MGLLHVAFHSHFGGRPLMTAMFDKLLAFLRAQPDAAAEDRGGNAMAVEGAENAPQALVAAVLRPLDGAAIDRTRLQGRGAGEVARAFPVRPALEQDADQHGDALSARPAGVLVVHLDAPDLQVEGW